MLYPSPGRFRSLDAFRAHAREVSPTIRTVDATRGSEGPFGRPWRGGGLVAGNRFAVQPMEGWDGALDGLPTDLTRRRWHRFGQSGAKLLWGGEAFAVREDGRANPGQLFLNPQVEIEAALAALRGEVLAGHRHSAAMRPDFDGDVSTLCLGLQLTHSGRFARPVGRTPAPKLVTHHPVLDARVGAGPETPLLTDGELEAIAECYVDAARLAERVGFHFVDLKACHGYLMHELLGARSRPGPYGGDFEGRTRLFRRLVEAVRSACPTLQLGVRISLADVGPHEKDPETGRGRPVPVGDAPLDGFGLDPEAPDGIDLAEPRRFLDLLIELNIPLVNVSFSSPYASPHLTRPASAPPSDGYLPPEDPLRTVERHLQLVREARRHAPSLTLVGSGYTYLQQWVAHVGEAELEDGAVDFVGLGRMMLSYPTLPADVLAGQSLDPRQLCRTFSDCTTAPRHFLRSGCYPLDDTYKQLDDAQQLREVKASLRARSRP